ncbi:tRNA (cmo5U34)-methyltransferase [Nitrospina gracilis 3/211]|uniref:Carboxy-S-adenosyl-L-methionine synthase n=1 Tax=Nitrospina gracilis (strain 3/211) TaxID=1266370 RepID=M1Z0H6_NITG3|nr:MULTISPECIES: carboxy-S-adenosyl-L-methionine synthase CmoA [Nitrospina]MCF8724072.1 tRNA (cmo5U34)-methyltransferase [Nitrospina sp. Nb-3]CCQ91205.1 tRNA (cmo5U34)-methyltransferase [Nitrospina gracilis 3/211]
MTPRQRDDLFARDDAPEKFEFNESVARVFDNMLERSVPFYKECQQMVVSLTATYAQPGTRVYDLGCSTGTLVREMARALSASSDVRFVGIDNSDAMIKKARRKLKEFGGRCEVVAGDLNGPLELADASVVVMNYTLQFLPPAKRQALLKRIHQSLLPGGALILIEKVKAEAETLDPVFVERYYAYKREMGYSRMEISRKREALEQVLVPLRPGENVTILEKAGFRDVDVFFKWFNFCGFVALRRGGSNTRPASGKKRAKARKSR